MTSANVIKWENQWRQLVEWAYAKEDGRIGEGTKRKNLYQAERSTQQGQKPERGASAAILLWEYWLNVIVV